MVSTQEQVQDLRQSIVELPGTLQYSCFHLEHKGERINDFIELSEVSDLAEGSELTLYEDPYNEKEARLHVIRVRELVGAAGDRVDSLHGIHAGLSLHDDVAATETKDLHALSDYDFGQSGRIEAILPKKQEAAPKTLKSIAVSPWNPPPHHLRQRGHLLYLQITTNEGEQFQVTSHVTGFYVNKSSNNKFDPYPRAAPKDVRAHSLLNLIGHLSPSFQSSFSGLQQYNNKRDPLSTFQFANAIPSNPWLVPDSNNSAGHQPDITRTQESFLIGGIENAETLRDWNEEFQSTRELPRESIQDRVFRERLTSKLFADYNDAAARGAVQVARGEISPLNPTEGTEAQIYVYNNVFFSYGADGVGTFAADGGDEAARVAVGKDVLGIRAVNQLDILGLFTPGTVVVDYLGKRLVGQSIVPGIFKQREPGEHQIDYGGVEGKDIVAANPKFIPEFEKLSKALRVKKHAVWDKEGKKHELEGSVETKGLIGTDGRKYVLDLYRITPLDVAWLEEHFQGPPEATKENKEGYPHRMAVLRVELVEAFFRSKMNEYAKAEVERRKESKKSDESDSKEIATNGDKSSGESSSEQERIDLSGFQFALNSDVCCGQVPQTAEEKEGWAKDEKEVRAACAFLTSNVLPELIKDLQDGEVGFPMDGQSLSQLLHKRGINVRYLGKVAALAQDQGARLMALKALAVQEMISRAFKHVANQYLRHLPFPLAPACLSHLLNCLLGTGLASKPSAEVDDELRSLYGDERFAFEGVSPESIQKEIEKQVRIRFRCDLDGNWVSAMKPLQMLREVSLKLGLQLAARDYVFKQSSMSKPELEVPTANGSTEKTLTNGASNEYGKSKKKNKKAVSPARSTASSTTSSNQTFHPDDVLNIVPVVKDAAPRSTLAEEALEAGRISILQNQKEIGQELILESLSLHEQVYGILHPEVARLYHQLSMLYYQTDEKKAAVELAQKAVIVSERTLGVDSAETILSYLNLGLFEHANGNTKTALVYVRHALELWKIIFGLNHPDSITTLNNAAVMLQHLKHYHDSRLWFEASLAISEDLFGKQSVNTATLLFQLAQALALDQDSKGAVNRMREAYNIFHHELGANDRNTKEAESWLEQLTQNAVSIAKHAKDLQNRRLRRIQLTPRVTLGTRPQPQVGQSSIDAANGAADPRSGLGLDSRSIDDLLKFIEGGAPASPRNKQKKRTMANNPKRRLGKQAAEQSS